MKNTAMKGTIFSQTLEIPFANFREKTQTPDTVRAFGRGIAAALAESPFEGSRPSFLEIRVRKGARKDLGRPTVAPVALKTAFMAALRAEQ